jgi:AAA+ superfamily predicted ATPase
LLDWVAEKCPKDGWDRLIARAEEPGSPPWLNKAALGLDDQVSHQILALGLAHSICLYGGIQDAPLPKGDDLECGVVLHRLGMIPPTGIQELAHRLAVDAPLRQQGLLNVEETWRRGRKRQEAEPFSVGRLLRTRFSLNVHALEKLLGTKIKVVEDQPVLQVKDLVLAEDVRRTVEGLVDNPPQADKLFTILLKGSEGFGKRTLTRAIADHLGQPLREINAYADPRPGYCSLIDLNSNFDGEDWTKLQDQMGILFLREEGGRCSFKAENLVDLVLDLGALDVATMILFCSKVFKDAGSLFKDVDAIEVGRSGITPGQLVNTVKRIQATAKWRPYSSEEMKAQVDRAVQQHGESQQKSGYAEVVEPKVGIQDLCLTPQVQERFQRIVRNIKGRGQMLENWGIDTALTGKAKGICLFHGPSGTGKSMAAEVLAKELGAPLWRIQASALENAYVGASESRLHEFFQEAKTNGKNAVLLLDEADSVLSDRSRAEGSTRRYQISLTNEWLRSLDQFEGVLVFTTNHASGLDPAIERRVQFRLDFPEPDSQVRARIWTNLFGRARVPGSNGLDLTEIAERFPLSGGLIRNSFMEACQRASEVGAISQAILLEACDEEMLSVLPGKKSKQIRGFAVLA